jgi:hypothetical protein
MFCILGIVSKRRETARNEEAAMNRRIYLIVSFVLVLLPACGNETKYGAIEIRTTPDGASVFIESFFLETDCQRAGRSYRAVNSEMHGNYVEDIVVEKLKTRSGRAI